MKEYVLVSQGIEIFRTRNKKTTEEMMNRENKDFYEYKQKCLDNGEEYADNEIEMYEEDK